MGAITYHRRTALHVCCGRMNVIYYRDNVLRKHVIPFFHQYRNMRMFQQDNARAHTTRDAWGWGDGGGGGWRATIKDMFFET